MLKEKEAALARTIEIPAPKEIASSREYRPTGKLIRRQVIHLHVLTEVVEYVTPEYVSRVTGEFLKAVSGGKLGLSAGMICGLSKEFSEKTQEERNRIFLELLASPHLHADFTFGRVNGKQGAVMVCVSGDRVLYQGKEKKEKMEELLGRYDRILKKAEEEYDYEPPGDYYRDGYNLYRRCAFVVRKGKVIFAMVFP